MPPAAPARPPLPLPAEAVVDPRIGSSGPCLLALEDGTVFPGIAFGAARRGGGDLVVNTSQTGYQEVVHRPSLRRAGRGHDVPADRQPRPSLRRRPVGASVAQRVWSWGTPPRRSSGGAPARAPAAVEGVPAIAGLSTRAPWPATCASRVHARHHHAHRARPTPMRLSPQPGRCRAGRTRTSSPRCLPAGLYEVGDRGPALVAIVDLGLKTNIVRSLHRRGARVRVLPHTTTAAQVLAVGRRGRRHLARSRRPGMLDGPVALARAIVADGRPLLGICLGHQIVARAAGAAPSVCASGTTRPTTRSATRPPAVSTMTAQNHEVEVVGESLPASIRASTSASATSTTARRGPAASRRCPSRPSSTTPRASPGPLDAAEVFDRFVGHVRAHAGLTHS